MEKLIVNSYDEFASHLGEVIGTSEWLEVSQERINLFADATLDHQWIHVDPERAKTESPIQEHDCAWLSHTLSLASLVAGADSGEQCEDAGELWHGSDEVRTAGALWTACPLDGFTPRYF